MSTHVTEVDSLMEAIKAMSEVEERLQYISKFIDSYSDEISLHNYVIPDILRYTKSSALWAEAIHVAKKARSLYPDNTKWYDIEIQICEFERDGNNEAALEATLAQLTLRGKYSSTFLWAGDRFAELGLRDRAWALYNRAIELAALEERSPHLIRASMVKLLIKEKRFSTAVDIAIAGICEAERLNKSGAPKSMIALLRRVLKGAGYSRTDLADQIHAKSKSGGKQAAKSLLEAERDA